MLACSISVSKRTTRRVAPSPETYAFSFVVRLLASATSTSATGTDAASPSASTASRRLDASTGRNLLKIGSSTTGATKLSRSATSAPPAAATSGQAEGNDARAEHEPADGASP